MNPPVRPLAEITEHAIDVLIRELGVADTARFLHQFGVGYGDYTEERDRLFGHLSVDDIIEQSRSYGRDQEEHG